MDIYVFAGWTDAPLAMKVPTVDTAPALELPNKFKHVEKHRLECFMFERRSQESMYGSKRGFIISGKFVYICLFVLINPKP